MTKISALSDIGTSVASNDAFVLVDVSDPTTPNKKIQQQNLFLIPDGSAGTPAVRFLNDTDVGLFRPTTNTLALATGGSERLRIDSSGRVGIGTSAPGAALDVIGSTYIRGTSGGRKLEIGPSSAAFKIAADTTSTGLELSSDFIGGYMDLQVAGSSRVYITSLGRVGIGTTSPEGKLEVSAGNAEGLRLSSPSYLSTSQGPWIAFNGGPSAGWDLARVQGIRRGSNAEGALVFYTNNGGGAPGTISEKARIDETGRLLVGTSTSESSLLQVNAQASASGNAFRSSHQIANSGTGVTQTNQAAPYISYLYGFTAASQVTAIAINGEDFGAGDHGLQLELNCLKSSGAVANGDRLGRIRFGGDDGANIIPAASIDAYVDNTPGLNDMPGRLVFSTTADGASSPTEQLRITSDRYVRLASGTGGIQFNGDTAAANALDDYEEGTWTPVDGSGAGLTFTSVQGRYTKVGNQVTCWGTVTYPTTANGNVAKISGLPFTTNINDSVRAGGFITMTTNTNNYQLYLENNATAMPILSSTAASTTNADNSTYGYYFIVNYFV
jgi:hypothetical protein